MRKGLFILIVVFHWQLFIGLNLYAQVDYQRQYSNAKALFKDSKYQLAMEAFRPLVVYDQKNPFVEYASFYYAISAYRLSYETVARDMLLQIKQLYPSWDKMDEVNYWLARIHFDNQEYYRAMGMLKNISNKDMQEEIAQMKLYYFSRINSLETFQMLYREFPDDVIIGRAYAKLILNQPLATQDKDLLEQLIRKFKLPREEFAVADIPKSVKKKKYTVAVLLPFMANNLQPNLSRKPNQFVLDLYEGILLGLDSLTKRGVNIELLVFDTERSARTTESILKNPQLKEVDLIIGPLYREPIKLVQEFSAKNKINLINPISNDADIIELNPFSYLFNPSFETLARQSADYLAERVQRRNCMIIYGDQRKDSVMAANFKEVALDKGLNIVANLKFRKENSLQISDILATPTELDDKKRAVDFTLKRDSLGCIYVASEDPLIYMKVISGIEARGDSIRVIGAESWLETATIDYGSFERLGISLHAPGYFNHHSVSYIQFRDKYVKKHGKLPGAHARTGYELMLFYGMQLHNYGVYFQHELSSKSFYPGTLLTGFNYSKGRDNQVVPIVRFSRGELMRVN